MTQTSMFWDGLITGDATASPYDAPTEFSEVLLSLAGTLNMPDIGGVFRNSGNDLYPSGAASPITIDSGFALVWGTWYNNSAILSVSIPTPISATRIDRIVVRKDWAAQTVRILRLAGAEGGPEQTMTQVAGSIWDIPIAKVTVTTGGAITTEDQRKFIQTISGANSRVGITNQRPMNFVPINPAIYIAHTGLSTSNPVLTLPGGVPPSAVMVSLKVEISSAGVATVHISSAAGDAVNMYEMSLHCNNSTDDIAGNVNIDPGSPCTVTSTMIVAGTVNVYFYVNGYYEYMAT